MFLQQKLGKQQELDGGKGTASIPAHPAAAVAAHQQATAIRKGAQAAQGDGDEDEGSSEEVHHLVACSLLAKQTVCSSGPDVIDMLLYVKCISYCLLL